MHRERIEQRGERQHHQAKAQRRQGHSGGIPNTAAQAQQYRYCAGNGECHIERVARRREHDELRCQPDQPRQGMDHMPTCSIDR